jgi:DNA-binding transcriptional MerR regulator
MADDSRKLFYSIGEVADIFQVNESTLRFWEKEFPTVIKPRKNAKGTRNYTKDDIEKIRLIHFLLKEKGMTLAGARKKLKEEKKGMTAQHELADRLKKIKSELLKLQAELGQPVQEAPEFEVEETVSKRMVFAAPGSEMIPVPDTLPEHLPEVALEELPEVAVEELPVPEPEFVPEAVAMTEMEASPFDFAFEGAGETGETIEVSSEDFEGENVNETDEVLETFETLEDANEPLETLEAMEELETEATVIPGPQPEPEPEPTPEQNLFYEQPESVEPPKPEPSKDGWTGTLF